MRLLSLTFFMLWASVARAADPPAPIPPTGSAATPPTAATTPTPAAAGQDPESRLARELSAKTTQGRSVELQAGGRVVLGIYTPQTAAKAKGAVILLHDFGGHADWPGVIAPLRRALPGQGWSTLSVQLPLPGKGPVAPERSAWLDQIAPRIDSALAFLKGESERHVVLAGHGIAAAAALDYAATHPEAVRGVVLIALPELRGGDRRLASGETLGRIPLPVLDIFGTADSAEIAATAPRRREAAGHKGDYLQVEAPGADHFFHAQGPLLTGRVRGWLDRHAKAAGESATSDNTPTKGTSPP